MTEMTAECRPQNWRLLIDDGVPAAEGLAVDEALMAGCGRNPTGSPVASQPTVRLYTYRDHCALVGRYQTLAAEIDLEACRETGTEVGRRPTGGGAIVMGKDQLGVALVVAAQAAPPRRVLQQLAAGIIAGLSRCGLTASFGGKNDLVVNGRKIAGLGLYRDDHGALLFHASVLADLDVDFMLRVLKIPATKLADKGITAVSERVTTVSRELGRPVSVEELRAAVTVGFAEQLDVTLTAGQLSPAERQRARELADTKYSANRWLHERNAAPDGTGTAAFKSPEGLIRVFVAAQGQLVKSVLFTGDFIAVPDSLHRLEAALRWRRLSAGAVTDAVTTAAASAAPAWESADEVVTAVLTAGARAVNAETLDAASVNAGSVNAGTLNDGPGDAGDAAPWRSSGSCYFPETAGKGH